MKVGTSEEGSLFMGWKSIVAGAALLLAALVGLGFFWPFRKSADSLRLPGIVEIQEVRLGSKCGGRVAEVNVVEGDIVQPGQVLVRFEVPELEAQRTQWQAQLESMEAQLLKAKHGPRPEEIRQAKSDLAAAEADLNLARQEAARSERLYRTGGTDRSDYDTTRANRDRAQGRVESARAKLDLLNAGTRAEEIADAEAKVAEMRGKIRELDANLKEAIVRAPERAVVDVLAVRKGDLVSPNQPIIRVLRADDLWVRVYVPETQLGKVRLGQNAQVFIDAYPGRSFAGQVFKIDAESEFTPRNVQSVEERRFQVFGVKIRVADPQGIFKSGMAADVLFEFTP
jgi:multidrug resistance efflux pump